MQDDKKREISLDDAAEKAGGYVDYAPGRPLVIDADYHAMSNYCLKKGVQPIELTEEEYKVFMYAEPLLFV